MNRIFARYEIETAFSLDEAIGVMAGEQSSGTFLAVPGETAELKERSGARVEWIRETGTVAGPSLPGARVPKSPGAPVWRIGLDLKAAIDQMREQVQNVE